MAVHLFFVVQNVNNKVIKVLWNLLEVLEDNINAYI